MPEFGDAADHIIQTFQMLNVDGCENINASFRSPSISCQRLG